MRFRPCIDLHQGQVKQIVGSTLEKGELITNFISQHPPRWYAELYKKYNLSGGHVVKLGKGNDEAALEALSAYPDGLHLGGGIQLENADFWLAKGAKAVLISSAIFDQGKIDYAKLQAFKDKLGKEKIVLDLSCGKNLDDQYRIYYNGWRDMSNETLSPDLFQKLSPYSQSFLIHSVDMEGRQAGIDLSLIKLLGEAADFSITYAGGITNQQDLDWLKDLGKDKIDFTIGSALDIFGGGGFKFLDLVAAYS